MVSEACLILAGNRTREGVRVTAAVVLVSGGAAVTPYTDTAHAAASGLAAGNTMTALRAHFRERGIRVFTAPARIGAGEVREDVGWQGFADVPVVLPAGVTINAVGHVDDAGRRECSTASR